MKAEILTAILTLLTFNSFAHDECTKNDKATDKLIQEEATKLETQRQILQLYQSGILSFSEDGKLELSEDTASLIEELKDKGIFEQIEVMGDRTICL
ncbi:MAG: hypothetical protein H6626_05375 [Pseudobdellovibrionaceae bacterium]|nr:MAG: hypothetical protein H6626_05375 [Pseudobdellovibrionaceae bacterium]